MELNQILNKVSDTNALDALLKQNEVYTKQLTKLNNKAKNLESKEIKSFLRQDTKDDRNVMKILMEKDKSKRK